jgi:hypothetical protein
MSCQVASFPGCETHWLQHGAKDLPQAKVVVVRTIKAAGLYYKPEPCEEFFDGTPVDCSKGILVINAVWLDGELDYANVLAHEWRHHWQLFNWGKNYDGSRFCKELPYRESIVKYFTSSRCEMDALLFSIEKHSDEESQQRLEWCRTARLHG